MNTPLSLDNNCRYVSDFALCDPIIVHTTSNQVWLRRTSYKLFQNTLYILFLLNNKLMIIPVNLYGPTYDGKIIWFDLMTFLTIGAEIVFKDLFNWSVKIHFNTYIERMNHIMVRQPWASLRCLLLKYTSCVHNAVKYLIQTHNYCTCFDTVRSKFTSDLFQ